MAEIDRVCAPALLELLEALAIAGAPLPTYQEIATRIGCDRAHVAPLLARLEADGFIECIRRGRGRGRRICRIVLRADVLSIPCAARLRRGRRQAARRNRLETAIVTLRRRGFIVYRASVVGGPADRFVVDRSLRSGAWIIARARRVVQEKRVAETADG